MAGVFILNWVLVALTFPMVCVRVSLQWRRSARRPWRELFTITAWLFFLCHAIAYSFLNDYNFLTTNLDITFYHTPPEQQVVALKVTFVAYLVSMLILYCCKAVLLCFYRDLAQPRQWYPITFWVIVLTWVLVIAGALVHVAFVVFMRCYPVSYNWALLDPVSRAKHCPPSVTRIGITLDWGFHLLTDLLVYCTPIGIIFKQLGNRPLADKLGASSMFAIGLFNVVSAIISGKLGLEGKETSNFNLFDTCMMIQMGTGITVICVPELRLLYRRLCSRGASHPRVEIVSPLKEESDAERLPCASSQGSTSTQAYIRDVEKWGLAQNDPMRKEP